MSVIEILNPHNLEAYQEINKLLDSGIKKIAIPRATGSGKTYIMGALAEKYNNEKKLVLEPTRPLLNSIEEKFNEFCITNTDFMTYQKLIRISNEDIAQMDYKLIFLDECHHGTAPVWRKKIDHLMATHSNSIVLGTSATTVRNDGVNVVESLFENNAIEEFPLSTAIARKVLPCPHYITAIYRLEDLIGEVKNRHEIRYESNYLIAQECIKQGIIITNKNPCFKDVNLYEWVLGTLRSRYDNNKMTNEEKRIIKQLIGFDLDKLGKRWKKPVPIKVICNDGKIEDAIYSSIAEAARAISKN